MSDERFAHVIGWILKWAIAAVVGLICIYLLAWIAKPVIEQVSTTAGAASGSFGGIMSGDIRSIAVLCILLIGAVGLAKVFRQK